jgi:uncharacterized membrane protein YeiH
MADVALKQTFQDQDFAGAGRNGPIDVLGGAGFGLTFAAAFIALAVGLQGGKGELADRIFLGLEAFSTLAFALAGTYGAGNLFRHFSSKSKFDFALCMGGGVVTGVGGGIIRDVITTHPTVIAAFTDPTLIGAAATGAMIGYFLGMLPTPRHTAAVQIMDSIAMAVAIIVGTRKGIEVSHPDTLGGIACSVMVCAMLTASGGGLLRDFVLRSYALHAKRVNPEGQCPLTQSRTVFSGFAIVWPAAAAYALIELPHLTGRTGYTLQAVDCWVAVLVFAAGNMALIRWQSRDKPKDGSDCIAACGGRHEIMLPAVIKDDSIDADGEAANATRQVAHDQVRLQ